jgi:hypothetical protein
VCDVTSWRHGGGAPVKLSCETITLKINLETQSLLGSSSSLFSQIISCNLNRRVLCNLIGSGFSCPRMT